MQNDLNGKVALDGSVIIALALNEANTSLLQEKILNQEVTPFTTDLACTELLYILCREKDWGTAFEKFLLLRDSQMIRIIGTKQLMRKAGRIKCRRGLALPDCFTLSLAKKYEAKAIFAKKEKELSKEMGETPFDIDIAFLS
ncbi:MAG: type II toxin-antitoxin system VapC family toxin [Candidatus Korarchaeota archaeon]|nr:type II toxin-antitoxin system VapC family toxin [Candidatus Korarchaeota archaeon]NIU82302.1 PIN domain-containing protein [Candidatus Thorarchaeota archaeon]NIW12790.1 PIN domain-containing protein [Candidatus Thorarchaeota archaeon]NIW50996.1 PIN domain-containing protein [Candidatus Korarchaeota archaeon]